MTTTTTTKTLISFSLLSLYEDFFSFCVGSFLSKKMRVWSRSLILVVLCITVATNANCVKQYTNHQLWRIYPTNNEQIDKILAFRRIAHLHNIDFWSENFHINKPVSFHLKPVLVIIDDFTFSNRSMFVCHLKQLKCLPSSCQEMMWKSNIRLRYLT